MSRKFAGTALLTGANGRVHERMVYVVQFGSGTPVKIGSTSDIGARLSKMSVDHYNSATMLYLTNGGFREEKSLHRRFSEHRVRGEWYYPVRAILDWCENECQRQSVDLLLRSLEWARLRKKAQKEEHQP